MAKKKAEPPVRLPASRGDVVILSDAFNSMIEGNTQQLDAWMEEYGISEKEFDAVLQRIGQSIGKTMGIL